MSSATGFYFDGETLRAHAVTLEFTADGRLHLTGDGLAHDVALADVRVSDRLGDVPRFLRLPGAAVVETGDNAAVDAALAARRRGRVAAAVHALETHARFAAAACGIVVALLAVAVYFGPPAAARALAQRTPRAAEVHAGQAALAAMDRFLQPSELPPAERRRVQTQLARLLPDRAAATLPRLEFRRLGDGLPNAFALPGDVIVVTDALVGLAQHDDELAAVLAHELGHLELRHGVQSVLRSSFALLLVAGLTGDLSTLTSFAGALPLLVIRSGYARDLEREADLHAKSLLAVRGIPAKHFSAMLLKLELARPATGPTATYLGTHPTNEERTRVFGALSTVDRADIMAQANRPPVILHSPAPRHPFRFGPQNPPAEVTVEIVVGAQGEVQKPRVVRATDPSLESAAIAAVRQWKFRPGLTNFRPVAKRMEVRVAFTVPERSAGRSANVGAAVTTAPVAVVQARPVYPPLLRAKRIPGEAVVDFIVDAEGNVRNAIALRSTHPEFGEAAVAAVRQWKFKPGRQGTQPAPTHMQVPVRFTLDEEPESAETAPANAGEPTIRPFLPPPPPR